MYVRDGEGRGGEVRGLVGGMGWDGGGKGERWVGMDCYLIQ